MKALFVVLSVLLLASAAVVRAEEVDDSALVEHDESDEAMEFVQIGEEDLDVEEDEDVAEDEDEDEAEDEEADEGEAEEEFEVDEESLMEVTGCNCGKVQTGNNEGRRKDCYKDTKGIPTIGIGFNLLNPNAAKVLQQAGVKTPLATIKAQCGKHIPVLTDAQMNTIFTGHYNEGVACAKSVWAAAPPCVAAGLADMALNMGCAGLKKFTSMIAKLKTKQWAQAVTQAKHSAWCKQVGTRCAKTTSCLGSGV